MPKTISIIIPCYNQSNYLLEAIDSCLIQTQLADEIVVVLMDEKSWALQEQLENLGVKCLIKSRLSLPAARNLAISKTTSDYIVPLDADDLIPPNYIEEVSKVDADIVYVNANFISDKINRMNKAPDEVLLRHFIGMHPKIGVTNLFKKQMWKDIGGYNEDFTYGHECWEFWYRAFFLGKSFKKCHTTYYIYKQYPTNGRAYIARDNFQIIRKQLKELYPGDFEVISRRNIPPKERKNFANLK